MQRQKEFTSSPSPADILKLQARVLNGLHFEKAERKIFYSRQRTYECGDPAGRLLAYLAHLDHRPPTVVSLRNTDGALLTDPEVVAEEFRSFASLYWSATENPREKVATLSASIVTHP